MKEFTIDSVMLAIGALAMRRSAVLDALTNGTSLAGEDDDHLPDLLTGLESALSEFRQDYENRRGDAGLYPDFDQLMQSHEQ